ncbi:MAG: D-aminoacyl-tRNA deacylase, partial [Betaproteobacteria bacterium]|nr:D-aminoacyl-tRNA deacylase [Betaproteobacteria bacterium]
MRVVVQRVSEAAVSVDAREVGRIAGGLLVLAGFEAVDGDADV